MISFPGGNNFKEMREPLAGYHEPPLPVIMKGVMRVLVDYKNDFEKVKNISLEGWGRL